MTNRCLTFSYLPAIDWVVFFVYSKKKSKIDIVQAAGRAMRIKKGINMVIYLFQITNMRI